MTFYFAMINAWSLAWEALYGDMDKEYPIVDTSVGQVILRLKIIVKNSVLMKMV